MADDRVIATNRRARHEYDILETLEAGLVLRGTEVKALRAGQVNFKDSYATLRNEEAWLVGCHISPYAQAKWYADMAEESSRLGMPVETGTAIPTSEPTEGVY